MYKVKLLLSTLVLTLAMSLALTGCAQQNNDQAKDQTPKEAKNEVQQTKGNLDLRLLVEEWDASGHSRYNQTPIGRDGCIACHSGYAYAKGITELAKLPDGRKIDLTGGQPATPPKAGEEAAPAVFGATPIDCMTCHGGKGAERATSGTVDIPTKKGIKAGASAACLACHNPRRVPDIKEAEQSAPHYSSQSDVFYASGGIQTGLKLSNTSAHMNIDNPCVYCHMPKGEKGQASHSFKMNDKLIGNTCGKCHQGINTFNLEAKEDYDGDGKKEGIQDEVTGLMEALQGAINDKLNGGKVEAKGGKFTFTDASGKQIKGPENLYQASYNLRLIVEDKSKGVHNPVFTVQLLQQSYKVVTGQDVPNAKLK